MVPKCREVADRSLIIFRASHTEDESIWILDESKFNLVLYASIRANNQAEERTIKLARLMHNDNFTQGQRFSESSRAIIGFKRLYL